MLLTLAIMALDVLKPADAPSFDCSKATTAVPRMICNDASLAALDRDMAARYGAWTEAHPGDRDAPRQQAAWLARRDACASAANRQACIVEAYQQRITELKVLGGSMSVAATALYLCDTKPASTVTASYYQSEPPAVLIDYQGTRVVAFSVPSASGARYATDEVELWEHKGVAALKWQGKQLQCPRK
jgi:uncharacterized protein